MGFMIVIAALVAFIGGAIFGYLAGVDRAKRTRRELPDPTEFHNRLMIEAAQHVALGDPFAQIVADELAQYHRRGTRRD